MKNSFFYLIVAVFGLFSCSSTHEISFNKNWSGSCSNSIDYSQMAGLSGDAEKPMSKDSSNVAKMEKLKKVKGISNIKTNDSDLAIVRFSFDFSTIESLNLACNVMYNDVDFVKDEYFKLKGKKELELMFPVQKMDNAGEDLSMFEQFGFNVVISTKRKILDVISDCANTKRDGNKVTITTNMMEIMDAGKCHSTTLKVK